jgi:uncharacterized protein YukE
VADLHGIEEDVPFDWGGADALAAKLESTAAEVDGQVPRRNSYAHAAREEWRGLYSRKFAQRMKICTTDAKQLSHSMRDAARMLRKLEQLAREEQERRVKAREWKARQHDGLLGAAEDLGSALGIVDKEEPPPVDHGDGSRFIAPSHMPGGRDQ